MLLFKVYTKTLSVSIVSFCLVDGKREIHFTYFPGLTLLNDGIYIIIETGIYTQRAIQMKSVATGFFCRYNISVQAQEIEVIHCKGKQYELNYWCLSILLILNHHPALQLHMYSSKKLTVNFVEIYKNMSWSRNKHGQISDLSSKLRPQP